METPTATDRETAAKLSPCEVAGCRHGDVVFPNLCAACRHADAIATALAAVREEATAAEREREADRWDDMAERLDRVWHSEGEERTTCLWFALAEAHLRAGDAEWPGRGDEAAR